MPYLGTSHISNKGCENVSVLTEDELRKRLKDTDLTKIKELKVSKNEIITPSARSFLNDHNISLSYEEVIKESLKKDYIDSKSEVLVDKKTKYETVFGARLDEKPEHMTHLYGNVLVFKDHKRIIFRGKIDSLEAKILEVQVLSHKLKLGKLVADLEEILVFVRNLIRCEVLNEPVSEFRLQGMDANELREKSHYPQKYFGIGHEPPKYTMGEVVVALNSIRTLVRETELIAYKAFKDEYGAINREDIIKALNRLSSLFWIMIFKYRTGKYSS